MMQTQQNVELSDLLKFEAAATGIGNSEIMTP
jgi:hypothetical protein